MTATWRELAMAGHTRATPPRPAALADPDPVARELALGALDRHRHPHPDELQTALADPAVAVRRRAVQLAAARPGTDLLLSLADPDPTVVEVAAWAAGEHDQVPDAVLHRVRAGHRGRRRAGA